MSDKGDILTPLWVSGAWGSLPAIDRVDLLLNVATKNADMAKSWYQARKRRIKLQSQSIRLITIALLTGGGIAPLVSCFFRKENETTLALHIIELGYIALALAGGLTLLDKLYGLSSGWMRYMVSLRRIESASQTFCIDWASLAATGPTPITDYTHFLERTRGFLREIDEIIDDEVGEWLAEFRGSIAQLDKSVKGGHAG